MTLGLLALLTFTGLVVSLSWIWTHRASEDSLSNPPDESDKIIRSALFSGDSISDGWYATLKSNGFVYRIQRELNLESSYHTHLHGYTVGQIAAKYTVPSGVDLAIIELGTNDVNKGTPLESFQRTYHDYVNRVMKHSPKAQLICLGVFPSNEKALLYDDAIQATCEVNNGHFVLMSDISKNALGVGPLGQKTWAGTANLGHPNDYGHEIIATRILKLLNQ